MKLSLIIPTYNEKENIKQLIALCFEKFEQNEIEGEMIIVDDNSPDGTGQILEELRTKHPNLTIIHRKGKLGLSSAVIAGFNAARGDILGVMDADLSHPVEKIGEMYQTVINGADLVIGSRYIKGGKIEGWNLTRKVLSRGATLLARVFVSVLDPMSGFFMFKKELLLNKKINSKGFKILLELLIKLDYKNVVEVPIIFTNRTAGKSKAGIKEIIYGLRNLIGYFFYKKELMIEFTKFAFVGFIGTIINIVILYTLTEYFKVNYIISEFFAFTIAISTNYIVNKIWTFGEKIEYRVAEEYRSYFWVSLTAFIINMSFLYIFTEFFGIYYLISQIMAIGISFIVNYIGNKVWTFHK